jgi:hypothetical protein
MDITEERAADYGHPLDNWTRIAKMWSVILDIHVTPEQVGLCEIATKIARECHKHKQDNLTDIAGYAKASEMLRIRRGW